MLAAAVPVPGIAERGAVPGGDESSSSIRAAVSAVLCAVLSSAVPGGDESSSSVRAAVSAVSRAVLSTV
jgi:hypothetical protein